MGTRGGALRDLRAPRAALSIRRDSTPANERTAKLPPTRVTFLNGLNRDFPKRRRHVGGAPTGGAIFRQARTLCG
jgi:hypothetical protein